MRCGFKMMIQESYETIAEMDCYQAKLEFGATKPNGGPRDFIDSAHLHALGWNRTHSLRQGIDQTYSAFCALATFASIALHK
jgi:GDP-L-fucose synthase